MGNSKHVQGRFSFPARPLLLRSADKMAVGAAKDYAPPAKAVAICGRSARDLLSVYSRSIYRMIHISTMLTFKRVQ